MPSGRIHAGASICFSMLSFVILSVNQIASLTYCLDIALGVLLGVLVSPDLDLMENGNYSMVILRKRSPLLAKLWRLFWLPYGKLSHHRGMSHWPIIGTLIRIGYLIIPIIIITIILIQLGLPIIWNASWFAPLIIGLMIADFIHIVMDVIF
jgi:uncharacterized metal-binding protein